MSSRDPRSHPSDIEKKGLRMFENTKAFSGFAVDDLGRAREFYEGTLGIRVSEEPEFLTLHLADGRDTLVYRKPDFTPGDVHDPELHRRRRGDGSGRAVGAGAPRSSATRASTRTRRASRARTTVRRSRGSRIRPGNILSVLETGEDAQAGVTTS